MRCTVARGWIDKRSVLYRRFEGEESHKDIRGIIEFLKTTSVCGGDDDENDRAEAEVRLL